MNYRLRKSVSGIALATSLVAWTGAGFAGTASTDDTTGRDAFLANLQAEIDTYAGQAANYLARSANVDKTGTEMTYNPIDDRDQMYGLEGYTLADADWARANLAIYRIYLALGGDPIDRDQTYRQSSGSYEVTFEDETTRTFSSIDDAHGYVLRTLLSLAVNMPPEVQAALAATSGNDIDDVLQAATNAILDSTAILARGRDLTVRIVEQGAGFSGANTPYVSVPDGMTLLSTTVVDPDTVDIELAIPSGSTTRLAEFGIYNAGAGFLPSGQASALVIPGSGPSSTPTDDNSGTTDLGALGVTALQTNGNIDSANDQDSFTFTTAAPADVTVASAGPSDVDVVVTGPGGEVARDEDGGSRYNFNTTMANLPAGTYTVTVSHCCDGIGPYSLSVSQ